MGYPVRAYRTAAARSGSLASSQGLATPRSSPVPGGSNVSRLFPAGPDPNIPRTPQGTYFGDPFANEFGSGPGYRVPVPEGPPMNPYRFGARAARVALPRLAARALPWLGWGLLAYDFYQLFHKWEEMYFRSGPDGSWTRRLHCADEPWSAQDTYGHIVPPSAIGCLVLQAISPQDPIGTFIPANRNQVVYYKMTQGSTLGSPANRFKVIDVWDRVLDSRTGPYVNSAPMPNFPPMPWQAPLPWPAVDPARAPIGVPMPEPLPIPWPMLPLRPGADPVPEGSSRGDELPTPRTEISLSPEGEGFPSRAFEPAGPRNLPRTDPDAQHRLRRPPPKKKDAKFIFSVRQKSAIGRLFNAVTETQDFVDALWYALPKECRSRPSGGVGYWKDPVGHWHKRKVSLQRKMQDVYKCSGHLNMRQAVRNLVANQWGDAMGGALGRINALSNRLLNKPGQGAGTVQRHAPQPEKGPIPREWANRVGDWIYDGIGSIPEGGF